MKKMIKRKPILAKSARPKAARKQIHVKKSSGKNHEMMKAIRDKFHQSTESMEKALKKMRKEVKKLGNRIEHLAD